MRVEIHRIGGDVYINGQKKIFAVDFDPANPTKNSAEKQVDWLIAWAKVGLMSRGYDVPHFETKDLKAFEPQ